MLLRRRSVFGLLFVGFLALVAACGGAEPEGECLIAEGGELVAAPCDVPEGVTPEPTPTPAIAGNGGANGGGLSGEQVFLRQGTCFSCHAIDSLPGAAGQIGPDLSHIGAKGAEYIREAILDPNAVIAPNCPNGLCPANVMPQAFGTLLTDAQIDALVDYLSGLQ